MNGLTGFITKYEMKGIERVLEEEEIIDAIYGTINKSTGGVKQGKEIGALVLTPTRVIAYNHRIMGAYSSIDYPLQKINNVNFNVGFAYADLDIHAGDDVLKVEKLPKHGGAEEFVKNLKTLISRVGNQTPKVQISQASYVDVADQIKKLADLKIQGLLTEEEFAVQKNKLLGLQ